MTRAELLELVDAVLGALVVGAFAVMGAMW